MPQARRHTGAQASLATSSRRKLLANSFVPWMVEFNGLIVDAGALPAEIQAEARRKGLIP
jgi:hypothetical protein